jgi:hypothetical protein
MPYTTVYLQYSETRSDDPEYDDSDDERDEDSDDFDYEDGEERCFIEFNPIRLTAKEPRGDSVELELEFEAEVGETLHLVVVRYNNHRSGVLEDWCVEQVFKNGDDAEELVESLEDGLANAECAEDKHGESVVVKAEVFSMQLHR